MPFCVMGKPSPYGRTGFARLSGRWFANTRSETLRWHPTAVAFCVARNRGRRAYRAKRHDTPPHPPPSDSLLRRPALRLFAPGLVPDLARLRAGRRGDGRARPHRGARGRVVHVRGDRTVKALTPGQPSACWPKRGSRSPSSPQTKSPPARSDRGEGRRWRGNLHEDALGENARKTNSATVTAA